ncbi:TetR/AcrR family transcriptional regulator [Paenibacillus qinlingensis]|uniref:AcrR family transcriptional regulator n=1 Tax=Paenibacillus qinlingensis TaxID=1837343 RepID=A0ABU1NXY7_9BACL|nr:TetR/AcrR family transcriptional regulator [Paenibacillus qinlingensis]MDR6552369.1 AcrR family transcriptional regulator [Paenibacillus qinlingensis]
MDRRIQKTRHSIMNTFIDLLAEKGFEKITINDIAERANINRGTVYLHYVDKFDLLDKCIETYVELLLHHCANSADTILSVSAFQSVFEYLEKNFTIYKLLLSYEGVGFFRNRLYAIIAQTVTEVVGIKSGNSALSNDVTTHFLTSGFIGVLEWWIHNSMPCSVQEAVEQLLYVLEPYTKHLVSHQS